MNGCLLIAGVLLSLTGIGAIIGIPMIIMAFVTMGLNSTSSSIRSLTASIEKSTNKMAAANAQRGALKGNCPYCDQEITCLPATPGLDCPACNQRVIVRNNSFLTLEDTKDETVVRPQLVPVNPPKTAEELKAARELSHKKQWKAIVITFYIILGGIDFILCLMDLVYQPLFSWAIFLLILFAPSIIWQSRQQTSQRKYPIGIVLASLFGSSILLMTLGWSKMFPDYR